MSRSSAARRWGRTLGLMAVMPAVIGLGIVPATGQQQQAVEAAVLADLRGDDSADFSVRFAQRADLSAASAITDWTGRGEAVVDALRKTADAGQAAVRAELDASGVTYRPFWVSNTIHVTGGSRALVDSLASRPGVQTIAAPHTYQLPAPTKADAERTIDAVEWGISAIGADDVWSTFGVRGEGVVVANIDTGVQYDHPALVGSYRGNLGGGAFDHDHNWFDPSAVCPGAAPCDNNDHGTHTMGTIVGDDGSGNQIGVAPNAKWIAAKGCESFGCSDAALLASGQWLLAPTDLTGANPRPDLRPHVVNNSWGGGGGDPWYADTVAAWRAAGIFPVFSVGGSGPACGGVGSPADYPESYAAGAFDINGTIASFSSRGAGEPIKPDITAPGVAVRSSVTGGGYAVFSGTSMAVPHVVGAVALVLSAAPSLVGDVAQTAALVDRTAVDASDLTCGGTPGNNNVWGEGRLDALTAVTLAPRGPTGTLAGTVTNARNGSPIGGAVVHLTGPVTHDVITTAAGGYSVTLPVGAYRLAVSAFGHDGRAASATVTEGETTTRDVALFPQPAHRVRGFVRDADGNPLAGATVTITGTPIPTATTDRDGEYSFAAVPHGTYQVSAVADTCLLPQTRPLTVNGGERLNFALAARVDAFGYSCTVGGGAYVDGDTPVALTGDDASATVALPFAFPFYGATYTQAFVSSNGNLNFLAPNTAFGNVALPAPGAPNAAVYPFWDDLLLDASSGVFTRTTGVAPNRGFVVEWRGAARFGGAGQRVDFEVVLSERGAVVLRYRGLDPAQPTELGASATVGIENATGTVALQYSFNAASLSDTRSIRFHPQGR